MSDVAYVSKVRPAEPFVDGQELPLGDGGPSRAD